MNEAIFTIVPFPMTGIRTMKSVGCCREGTGTKKLCWFSIISKRVMLPFTFSDWSRAKSHPVLALSSPDAYGDFIGLVTSTRPL